MAEFLFQGDKKVHYEIYGEGKPLLVLNGLMMSTNSWKIFVNSWSKENKLILIDMLDQGQSVRMVGKKYTQQLQADMLKSFLDEIGVEKTSILGISYGGEVAIQFSLKYAKYVDRLVLADVGARTNPLLRDFGYSWNEMASSGNGRGYYFTTIPLIYSQKFYEKNYEWMRKREQTLIPYFSDKSVLEQYIRLVDSAENYNELDNVHKISCPTLLISAMDDALIPTSEQQLLKDRIPDSHLVLLPNCGHASMYEQPTLFSSLVV